jgi:glutathione peroxidase
MKYFAASIALLFLAFTHVSIADVGSLYDIAVTDIDGNPGTLQSYEGKVLLIVNTASKCGFTPQYEGLQSLYETYKDRGLIVLGFPSNDFLGQEPGSDEEIKEFCSLNFNVSFPMYSKISVKGNDIHPLYDYLTSKDTNPEFPGKITWNFNKFLIDRDGNVVARYDSKTTPEDPKLLSKIDDLL